MLREKRLCGLNLFIIVVISFLYHVISTDRLVTVWFNLKFNRNSGFHTPCLFWLFINLFTTVTTNNTYQNFKNFISYKSTLLSLQEK